MNRLVALLLKLHVPLLLIVLGWLQIQLWGGSGSLTEVNHLRQAIVEQQHNNAELREMNTKLHADITNLKGGVEVVEELARSELGMTSKGETFYHIIALPKPAGPELPDE